METVTLNNGVKMPKAGFGVFQVKDQEECTRSVLDAIDAGYRLIDTAQSYGNEEAVGKAIAQTSVPREELFLTTKVWISNYGYEKAKQSVLDSLEKWDSTTLISCCCISHSKITMGRIVPLKIFTKKERSARSAYPIFIQTVWSTFAWMQKSFRQ